MIYKNFQDMKLSALGMGAMRLPRDGSHRALGIMACHCYDIQRSHTQLLLDLISQTAQPRESEYGFLIRLHLKQSRL